MGKAVTERETALQILLAWEKGGAFLQDITDRELARIRGMDSRFLALVRELSFGTVERLITIDYHIGLFSKTPVEKVKPLIRNILRIAVYQILYLDRIPDFAAVNEAVTMTKAHGFSRLAGFVNAVLRKVAAEKENIEITDISIRYSVPKWITNLWVNRFGEEETIRILEGVTARHPLCVRIDERLPHALQNDLIKAWEAQGITAKKDSALPYAYDLSGVKEIAALYGFDKGFFYVQDKSSMYVAEMAKAKRGDVIIDTCAAPGGKILHLYAKLDGAGTFIARDISQNKCAKILENKLRMRADALVVEQKDATAKDPVMAGKADLVLCDVPCSGLGVMAKKTDIRYRVSKEEIESLFILQQDIVKSASDLVKQGGTLIYSTCTVGTKENEEQAAWIASHLPVERLFERCFLPGKESGDGFFIAGFRKR